MKKKELKEEQITGSNIKRRTLVSFSVFFVLLGLGIGGWIWLNKQDTSDGTLKPLRKVLNANEKVNNAFFSDNHLVKEYPKSKAEKDVRVNGDVGMGEDYKFENWKLTINRHPESMSPDSVLYLTVNDVKSLPYKGIIFDFKCIEGWSQVTNWGGVKFSDFLAHYHLGTHSGRAPDPNHPEDLYKYVGLMTPDSAYYVGIDMKSMMHPQTILAYEMNDSILPVDQGYPVRLIIPIKYGIKSIKRIGYIYFSDTRPKDYWFERGYDYDAAL
ncbi:MAG TPA: molybdopterin-dependent oxidoreductase [Bacteroidia bacterium]|nr:molybdopterin-dependent oxidoreductase [Bacteroidia bacterium]